MLITEIFIHKNEILVTENVYPEKRNYRYRNVHPEEKKKPKTEMFIKQLEILVTEMFIQKT